LSDNIDVTKRESFSFFEWEKIRFSDTDMIGHVNNVAYAALLEGGRTAFGFKFLFPHMPAHALAVMARVEIDYRQELHWPAAVEVGTRIVAVGGSSYAMGQGVFHGDRCVATGRTTLVLMDRASRRSTPLPDDYRALLLALKG
jgi:acyl-CoA thioester hydrolase